MAYAGYLVKVGNYIIPNSKIRANTFKTVKTIIDLDTYRDANGVLHRNALDHVPYKVELNLITMYNTDLQTILSGIKNNFSVPKERKANVTFYDSESDSYITQEMYMPDIDFSMYGIFDDKILYNEITLKFIGY